ARFADGLDAVTCEFENVPAEAAAWLAERLPVHPAPHALRTASDRLLEKQCLADLAIPTAPFAVVDHAAARQAALPQVGLPAVLKTRRLGYDGKGQAWLRQPADVPAAWAALGGVPAIVEGAVPFHREVSILAVRSRAAGETAVYPLVENTHEAGIL